ncbi:RNA polymerase II transcriptional coactivator [Cladophialophora carrionii]|uniref:RNA polymerase II transcriptional coactivator n=1 Tax=Cladophialophora carrionii TaxID=86049 RepID=A0A1C1CXB4_9EURO|nr:RNA polymerase II transcriptional coactivator [Cladophialophora carrionii]
MKTKNKTKAKDKASASPSTSTPKKDHLKNPSHPYTFEHLHNAYITSLSHGNPMPFTNKRKSAADSDVEDVPTTKRGKGASGNAFRPSSKVQIDADGNKYWEIAKARRVTLSEYKGQTMVGIREYYEKDGQWLPGKKGISLTLDQYSALIQITPQIEDLLKSQGEKVPRPNYSGNAPAEDQDQDDSEGEQKDVKPNIDATSDEDE